LRQLLQGKLSHSEGFRVLALMRNSDVHVPKCTTSNLKHGRWTEEYLICSVRSSIYRIHFRYHENREQKYIPLLSTHRFNMICLCRPLAFHSLHIHIIEKISLVWASKTRGKGDGSSRWSRRLHALKTEPITGRSLNLTTNLKIVFRSRKRGSIYPLSQMSSRRSAYVVKHRDNLLPLWSSDQSLPWHWYSKSWK
jgi:hypothetical protein